MLNSNDFQENPSIDALEEAIIKPNNSDKWTDIYFILQNLHAARRQIESFNKGLKKSNIDCRILNEKSKNLTAGEKDGRTGTRAR